MNLPAVHVLVSDEVVRRRDFRSVADDLRRALGDRLAIHLRCREATGRGLFDIAAPLVAAARENGGWCVVNGRSDVALAAGCHAIQLGRGALPAASVLELVADRCAVGVSVHSASEASRAADDGANFVVAGTVYRSASHPDRPGAGPGLVRACAGAGIPVVAIGGITVERAGEVVANGAAAVAVISAVWSATDPVDAACSLAEAVTGQVGGS